MESKKVFKKIFILFCVFIATVGVYSGIKNITESRLFTVRSVEIRGVINSDRSKLSALGKKLIGLNVFSENMEGLLHSEDPWVQKIVAVRSLPDSVNMVVYEEKPLFSFQDEKGKCYVFTGGNKRINTSCEGVWIKSEKLMTDEQAFVFSELLKKNPQLTQSDITLKDYSFSAVIDGDIIYCPYDTDIFNENYAAYRASIKKLYKTVEYVDLTIDKRIFVKGARNESSKG